MNGNLPPGSQPVVKIDGEKIRHLREVQGLTQLYLATSVGVTTDTISRWENKRYPTIKKENALKLAEALEVSLDEIIDRDKSAEEKKPKLPPLQEDTPSPSDPSHQSLFIPISILSLILLVTIGVGAFFFLADKQEEIYISARRLLPPHAAPGQIFPVLIQLENPSTKSRSIIIKEVFPSLTESVAGVPAFTTHDNKKHMLKWISQASDGRTILAYILRADSEVRSEQTLIFSGEVTQGKGQGRSDLISGPNTMLTKNFHWADTNTDNVIDDEEILAVYDSFGNLDGLAIDREQIDTIWSSAGYRWDSTSQNYVILP